MRCVNDSRAPTHVWSYKVLRRIDRVTVEYLSSGFPPPTAFHQRFSSIPPTLQILLFYGESVQSLNNSSRRILATEVDGASWHDVSNQFGIEVLEVPSNRSVGCMTHSNLLLELNTAQI